MRGQWAPVGRQSADHSARPWKALWSTLALRLTLWQVGGARKLMGQGRVGGKMGTLPGSTTELTLQSHHVKPNSRAPASRVYTQEANTSPASECFQPGSALAPAGPCDQVSCSLSVCSTTAQREMAKHMAFASLRSGQVSRTDGAKR